MNRLITLILLIFVSCSTIKYVPIKGDTVVEYRDTTIIKDSIVYTPIEVVKEVVPMLDTLKMSTSLATATAYIDTATITLKGKIENKKGITEQIRYKEKIVYRDSISVKEVPIPVEVVKTVHPTYEKWLWLFVIAGVALIALYLYKNTNISRWIAGMMKIK